MKKLLLMLLLTILPIQYSWSMAAVYCQHEPTEVSHFGHHTHHHQATSDEGGAADKNKSSKAHNDCEVCHHAVQASVPTTDVVAIAASGDSYALPPAPQYLSYISEGPPRPNWLLVA